MEVVTRFAPSPTGHLHIGGARTAVFCWLFARHYGGKFLLRIEDTDLERSKQEYTDSIRESLAWLGLDHDGQIIYQTHRFELYNSYIEKLLASGHAYWCECSPEQVEAMREHARKNGQKPRYDGSCRNRRLQGGSGRVVRLAAPLEGSIVFDDLVKGHVTVAAGELDDMVIRRSDGAPTYNLAVVVDDIEMGISHVIRGDDHVNNTPKQLLVYQALQAPLPIFAHVPMILGQDKQKLSKRHGAKAVIEYEKDGLLAEGLLNYLVRLGWSYHDQEIFSLDELIRFFDGTNLNSSPAAFDPEKLLWVNAQHLRHRAPKDLLPKLSPFLHLQAPVDANKILQSIPLFQPRASTLLELADHLRPLLQPGSALSCTPALVKKHLTADTQKHLAALADLLNALPLFSEANVESSIQSYLAANKIHFRAIGPALRIALLGKTGGPELAAIMTILGKEETVSRLRRISQFCMDT